MSSRFDNIQSRSIYVGASTNPDPALGDLGIDGNLGVGTPTPVSAISVYRGAGTNAYIEVSGNGNTLGSTSMLYGQDSSNQGYVWNRANAPIIFGTNGNTRMYLTSGGNLGIGGTNPLNKLSVSQGSFDVNATQVAILNSSNSQKAHVVYDTLLIQQDDAPTIRLYEYGENLSTTLSSDGGVSRLATTGILAFNVNGSSNSPGWNGLGGPEVMRMIANGNVGIGTTIPGTKLDVNGNISGNGLYYNGSFGGELRLDNSNGGGITYYADQNGHNFYTWSGSWVNRLSITDGGNIGIGTTSPYTKLDINGTVITTGTLNSTSGSYSIDHPGINTWKIGITSDNSSTLHIGNDTGGSFASKILNITAAGAVGISTTSPIASLDNQGSLGTYRQRGVSTMVTNILYADGTSATRYEIARATIDYNDWNETGIIEIELYEKYYSDGLKKRYLVTYGWSAGANKYLVEMSGTGANNFQVSIGTPVVISGDLRYLPIYVELRYYNRCIAVVKTNRNLTTDNPPGMGGIWFNNAPAMTYISDFSADSAVYAGNVIGGNTIFPSGNVGIGVNSPDSKLHIGGTNTFLTITDSTYNRTSAVGYLDSANLYLANDGGSNTYIGRYNNVFLAYGGGSVGVGTTNTGVYPFGAKLNVAGNISINGTKIGWGVTDSFSLNGIDTAHYGLSSNFNLVQLSGYYGLVFATTGYERMRISDGGNVGIGTTSPGAKLEIYGSGSTGSTAALTVRNAVGTKLVNVFDDGLIQLNNLLNINQAIYINSGNSNRHYALESHIFNVVDSSFQRIDFVTIQGNLQSPAMGVGTMSPERSAILDVTSRSKGFLPPRMTNTEMNAISTPAAGLVVYDTTNNKLTVYNGSTWVPLH
jgi:hypothetical protein